MMEKIENKKAYFCKIMTNKCLDVLKSSRYKREQYIGPWNPEPLLLEKRLEFDPSEAIFTKRRNQYCLFTDDGIFNTG